jgi:hypothetical protein
MECIGAPQKSRPWHRVAEPIAARWPGRCPVCVDAIKLGEQVVSAERTIGGQVEQAWVHADCCGRGIGHIGG